MEPAIFVYFAEKISNLFYFLYKKIPLKIV
jgi:hypothetical protein